MAEKHSTSTIYISKSAIKQNLSFIKNTLGEHIKISSVIKSDAYGHGIEKYVPLAEECGIDHFAVFSSDEALRTCSVMNCNSELMIMGYIHPNHFEEVLLKGIEFFIFDVQRFEEAILLAKKLNVKAKIHIELETGMYRTGVNESDITGLIRKMKRYSDNYELIGLCTHYAGAESMANYFRIQKQIRNFRRLRKRFERNKLTPKYRHTACSAASIVFPETRMDMVRVGIWQYGYWPTVETFMYHIKDKIDKTDPLTRIISWKSDVMTLEHVPQGNYIGYGTSFLATEDLTIAIVPVGYSHGYNRSLSNSGRVLIKGKRVGVIGTVNMNMLMLDVTKIENINVGDEVVLIGKQGDLEISVHSFSEMSDQLNYELLARIPSSIPRIVVE